MTDNCRLVTGLSHMLFPQLCPGCSKPLVEGEEVLCIACLSALPETGFHSLPGNDAEKVFSGRVPFVRATSFAYFTPDGLVQHLVHALKYQGKREVGDFLGRLLGQRLAGCHWGSTVDMVVAVPLHKAKEEERGYNQSFHIAAGIAGALGRPVAANVLHRTRATESQTHKTRTERVSNMAGAFAADAATIPPGTHILLCDDVLTTGATLEACALALQAVANVKISFATIGIAGQ
jgi:ComF family protein